MISPPDPPPPVNPATGRLDTPVRCAVCGWEWYPPAAPCTHTEAELEAYFSTQPAGPEQRKRWWPLEGEKAVATWRKIKEPS
jgi:hypothetical protein